MQDADLNSALKSLQSEVVSLRTAVQEQISAIRDGAAAVEKASKEIPAAITSLNTPEDERVENRAYQKKHHSIQVLLVIGTFGAFLAAAIYAGIADSQLSQMRKATQAATKAANAASDSLEYMNGDSGTFDRTMGQMITQTTQQVKAANAAKSAADIANHALHISERAYLRISELIPDIPNRTMILPVINTGHIPSGDGDITIFEITLAYNPTLDNEGYEGVQTGSPIEGHWSQTKIGYVTSGGGYYHLRIKVPQLTASFTSEHRTIIIAGEYTYGDGFPDDPRETHKFCTQTIVGKDKSISFGICNPDHFIPAIKQAIHYPDRKEKNDAEYSP